MESKKLGEHIAKLRRERHMTQTELADRLYVTEKAVSKWECGNGFPDLDNIGKLAAVFYISIDELLPNCYVRTGKGLSCSNKNYIMRHIR